MHMDSEHLGKQRLWWKPSSSRCSASTAPCGGQIPGEPLVWAERAGTGRWEPAPWRTWWPWLRFQEWLFLRVQSQCLRFQGLSREGKMAKVSGAPDCSGQVTREELRFSQEHADAWLRDPQQIT